jgi:phosphoadenosine phosphosulfate reductase
MIEHIEAARTSEEWSAEDCLRWAFLEFEQKVAISSAFGPEGMVLIDMASRVCPALRVFTLDTGFLFPETYDLMTRVEKHYGIKIEKLYPQLSPQEQECRYGAVLWSRDADQCCNLRKVEPLKSKLSMLRAWITGIRRDQTTARAKARKLEWDSNFQLYKINPLIDWTATQVWHHIHEHRVPYNPLHDRGYPSIGCTHCTRAVTAGHDPRSGRWPNLEKTECGLHITCQ